MGEGRDARNGTRDANKTRTAYTDGHVTVARDVANAIEDAFSLLLGAKTRVKLCEQPRKPSDIFIVYRDLCDTTLFGLLP